VLGSRRLVVAIDCEMVGTGPKGHRSELARCSILNYHGDVVYDKYILPVHPVMDYRTRWSGIRKRDLKRATPFLEARGEILDVLRGKVVIGHALCNDFLALGFVPPGGLIRDTSSRLFKEMCGFHNRRLVSLKSLSLNLLNRRIQDGKGGHCSVEDAQATLDLYKLVEEQWEQIMASRSKDGLPF
uniref:Exonuclease domain-containing protein n=1 Tax=Denticeps clupeoides TaxID=299321 RepID=A0AAY4AZH2_9TELE